MSDWISPNKGLLPEILIFCEVLLVSSPIHSLYFLYPFMKASATVVTSLKYCFTKSLFLLRAQLRIPGYDEG